jgi:hypothetical protein
LFDGAVNKDVCALAEASAVPITHDAHHFAVWVRSVTAADQAVDALTFRTRPLAAADY